MERPQLLHQPALASVPGGPAAQKPPPPDSEHAAGVPTLAEEPGPPGLVRRVVAGGQDMHLVVVPRLWA